MTLFFVQPTSPPRVGRVCGTMKARTACQAARRYALCGLLCLQPSLFECIGHDRLDMSAPCKDMHLERSSRA